MKKITVVFSLIMLISVLCLNAQENNTLAHRHELKLNLGSSVFLAFPEVSYEYILNEDMSVGVAMGFGYDTENWYPYNFMATPYLRWFFGDWSLFNGATMFNPASGFFLEANAAMGNMDNYKYFKNESIFTAGLGFALGWKYLTRNNWTGELFVGLGRNFIYDEFIDGDVSLYARFGISIGKRF